MSLRPAERGSAIVEFHFLGLLLLVPLVYVLLAVLDVQRASYGVTGRSGGWSDLRCHRQRGSGPTRRAGRVGRSELAG